MQQVSQMENLGLLLANPEAAMAAAAFLLPTGSEKLQAWLGKAHEGLTTLESYLDNPGAGQVRLLELRGEFFFDPVYSVEATCLEQLLADPAAGRRKLHSVRKLLLCLNDGEQ